MENSHVSGLSATLADMSETDVIVLNIAFTPLLPQVDIVDFIVKFCKDYEEEKGKKWRRDVASRAGS